jgi:asparagine synthase (glutamine-hydrolysing)
MCGIVGVAGAPNTEPLAVESVRRMADRIVHRGPDDEGFFASEGVVLGMRRLSIIDLAGGHQPIANEDETVWVVCNGEIYNYRSLRNSLVAQGHRFRTGSDVEVIVHLYEQYGEAFLDHLSGMFGLALWDTRCRRLIIARDRLGQKPLYYHVSSKGLAFASEIKGLLALPWVRAGVDASALREYLALGYCVAPGTIFTGIQKLPPATKLKWEGGHCQAETYWSLPIATRKGRSSDDWAAEVRSELQRAVTEHMVSDVPIGAFLSGGIDSSAVVAFMAQQSGRPVNTYSIGYSGGGAESYYNELSYASQVAGAFGTNHHEILVAPNVTELLPKLLWHLEEPISDSAIATTFLVSELAAQSVTVILSGVGGDELFAGYRRYLGEHYASRYRLLPGWMRHGVLDRLAEALPSGRQNRALDLARYAKRFVRASELSWRDQYRLFVEILSRDGLANLLLGDVTGPDGFDRVAAAESGDDVLLRLMRIDSQTQLPEDLLLLTDKMTMAKSIECRVPFLDHRLVELAAQIPADIKIRGGALKHLLKTALKGVLHEEILNRSKRGFGAPVGNWFKSELRPLRQAILSKRSIESRGLLAWPAVESIVAAHDANREDYSDLILVLINLELWCRLFIDGRSSADLGGELAELARAA